MRRAQTITWIGATVAAMAAHSAAVLAFASLLGERLPPPRGELRLDQANILSTQPLKETASTPLAANNSSGSKTVQAAGDSASIYERTEVAAIGEARSQAKSIPATQVDSTIGEAAAPDAPQVITGGVLTGEPAEIASIGETHSQVKSASVANVESSLTEATAPSLAEARTLDQAPAPAYTSDNAASVTSTEVVVSETTPDVVPAMTQTAQAVDFPNTVAAAPVTSQPITDAVSTSASSALTSTRDNTDAAIPPSSPPAAEASQAESGSGVGAPQAAVPSEALVETAPSSAAASPVDVAAEATEATDPTAPLTTETQVAIVVPETLPPRTTPAEPPSVDPVDILSAVRRFESAPCFLAVPEQVTKDQWLLRTYGAGQEHFAAFEAHVRELVGEVPNQRHALQKAQCAAADFASSFLKGGPPSLAFSINDRRPASGSHIKGTIAGFNKPWIYLLLVDDEGVAQDVSRYASIDGGDVVFDIPVHVKGSGRNRTQLLFAVSSDHSITMLDVPSPRPLAEVIPLVRGQIAASKAQVDIAVQDFSVE